MAFCSNCGQQLVDGAKFCSGCGTPVGSAGTNIPKPNDGSERVQKFAGEIIKCANCGAVLPALARKCPECGWEVTDSSSRETLMAILSLPDSSDKARQISNLPVPNTKDGIFEFFTVFIPDFEVYSSAELSQMRIDISNSKATINMTKSPIMGKFATSLNSLFGETSETIEARAAQTQTKLDLYEAKRSKVLQVYAKAKILCADDPAFMQGIDSLVGDKINRLNQQEEKQSKKGFLGTMFSQR